MKNLGFVDIWRSKVCFAIAIAIIVSPLLYVLMMPELIPNNVVVLWEDVQEEGDLGVEIVGVTTADAKAVLDDQSIADAVRERLFNSFLSPMCLASFVLTGFAISVAIAKPLELRYFFVELTFSSSRLRLFLWRFGLVFLLLAVAFVAKSIVTSAVLYVAGGGYITLHQAFVYSIVCLLLTGASSSVVSALFSLLTRSTSLSMLSIMSTAIAIEVVATTCYEPLRSITRGLEVLKSIESLTVFVVLLLTLAIAEVVAIENLEY